MAATPNFGWPTPDDDDLVSEGAQAIRALGDAIDGVVDGIDGRVTAVETEGFRYAGTVYFESDGTFSKANPLGTGDIGLRAVRVRLVAGGGGGASGNATGRGSGGGGGGGYAEAFVLASALASAVTVTRGAGGAGGSDSAGAGGGSSSFGSHALASGGIGGGVANAAPGGQGLTGDLLIAGSGGTVGDADATGGGGGTQLAGSVRQRRPTSNINGEAGNLYGGGGMSSWNTSAVFTGGAGANGIVIVDCFI